MFDRLSNRLQSAFRNLRGVGQLSEKNVQDALREVRLALLEADVHYATAKEFIERVKAQSLGARSTRAMSPSKRVVDVQRPPSERYQTGAPCASWV